jgi:hypothetical protein
LAMHPAVPLLSHALHFLKCSQPTKTKHSKQDRD